MLGLIVMETTVTIALLSERDSSLEQISKYVGQKPQKLWWQMLEGCCISNPDHILLYGRLQFFELSTALIICSSSRVYGSQALQD